MPPRAQDTEDKIGTQQVRVGSSKRGRGDDGGSGSDDYSDDDDDDDDGPLHPAAWLGMHPGLVAAHLQLRPCDCCSQQTPAPLLGTARDRRPGMLPAQCLGNSYERRVLVDYLREKGIDVVSMLQDCLTRVEAGTFELRVERAMVGPGGRTITIDATVCHNCWDAAFTGLCYQYRAAIPAEQLPAAVTARPNCWYGKDCRTQRHNLTHASRLSHICEPTAGGGGGKGKGGGKGGGGKGGRGGGGRSLAGGRGAGAAVVDDGGNDGGGGGAAVAAVGGFGPPVAGPPV